jgi:hypothetical protein
MREEEERGEGYEGRREGEKGMREEERERSA